MAMRSLTGEESGRGAWTSVGAVVVVAVIAGGNLLWWLGDRPDPEPMTEAARLGVLQDDRDRAQRAEQEAARAKAVATAAAADPALGPAPKRVEVTAAQVKKVPLAPIAVPTERLVTIQPGETLTAALGRLFIHGPTAARVVKAYSTLRKPRRLQVGQRLFARFESPSPMDAEGLISLVVAPRRRRAGVTVVRRTKADRHEYVAKEGGVPGSLMRRALRCGIGASLSRSLSRCGHGPGLASLISVALGRRMSLRSDVRAGDEIRVVFDELVAAGERVRYERLLAISYRGQRRKLTGIYFDDGRGRADWFAASGSALEPMFLREPVSGGRHTSSFGMRLHPILGVRKMHNGTDFAAATGTPIKAAADGKVIKVKSGGAAGRHVRIKHLFGYQSEYMHLSRFARRTRVGAAIKKGQVLGYVGTSGRSTAPHLHYGIIKNGNYIDPVQTHGIPGIGVAARDKKRFAEHAAELMKLLRALDDGGSGDT